MLGSSSIFGMDRTVPCELTTTDNAIPFVLFKISERGRKNIQREYLFDLAPLLFLFIPSFSFAMPFH